METENRYSLMIEALAELAPEIEAARTQPRRRQARLSSVLSDHTPLPRAALFLGLAEDGLPVLLNLLDPVPGALLVAGDSASGKTRLLQTIARSIDRVHQPQEVQYGVITAHPEEWANLPSTHNRVALFSARGDEAGALLDSLAAWAHSNRGEKQSVLLLVDDLCAVTALDFEARQNLRWLLLRGPARRVWPIVAVDPSKAAEVSEWLELFRTRCFGSLENDNHIRFLAGAASDALRTLEAGSQFAIAEDGGWLKFRLPELD